MFFHRAACMEIPFLINTNLDDGVVRKILVKQDPLDPIKFAIVGDITSKATYGKTVFLATKSILYSYDPVSDSFSEPIQIKDIAKIWNKRMYGNGLMRITTENGEKKDIFRFNFTIASLCDAAITYVTSIHDGTDPDEAFSAIKLAYIKLLSVCPKCGRTLSSPGVQCVSCMNKGKLIKKLGYYIAPEWVNVLIAVIMSVITTAMALVPPYLTKILVDDVFVNEDAKKLGMISVALLVLNVIMWAISGVRGYILGISGTSILKRLRCDIYDKAQHLPMQFYDRTSTGSVVNRIIGDTENLKNFMLRVTQEVIVQFFKLIGIVLIMLFMNWKLTLLSLIPVPLVVVGSRIFAKKIMPFYHRIWKRWAAVVSTLFDTIPGIRVIKSFTNEKNCINRFSDKIGEQLKWENKAGVIIHAYPAIVNCLIACGSVVIWALGGKMVISGSGEITAGLLVSFISYASMFYEPVNFFANFSDSTQSAISSAERLLDVLDAEPEHDFGKGNCDADIGGRIEFKNVNFSFDRTKKVLKNINLVIEPGDIVGIVGTTGSGKSTLVNLLLRYYDHYDGTITVGGVDIRDIDIHYYRSHIGFVQQEPMMFHDTIFNNIAYGDDSFTVDEVINAADIANAHEFIIRQPDGYDCVLGERGTGLSGGERQRVSIARAMLRNPKMLVFDEATASVDSETEHLIQEAIERLISGRTTIMIAHRLSTLSKANKIVVVDNGEILECGTPKELMEKKGKYYKLVEIQSMSDKVAESKRNENFE